MGLSRAASPPALPMLELTRMELRIGRRSAAFRFAALIAFAFGWSQGNAGGAGVGLSAYGTAESAWQVLGFVTVIWMSLTAIRETTLRTDILLSSKPQPNERLALVKFLGAFSQILLILLAMFLGAACGRLFNGGLMGAEVYLIQYLRVAAVLFFAASASYTLALLFDSAIAGALIALYWILTLSGKAYLAKVYFPAYTQNLSAYLALGLGLLLLTLWLYRRKRRGATPPAPYVRFGAPFGFVLAGWLFWNTLWNGHDPQTIKHPVLERVTEQDAALMQRAPGFLLPDQNGKQTGLTDFKGKILIIALAQPREAETVTLLDKLNALKAQYGAQGVQPIGVLLSEDDGAAATFARGERLQYPLVSDWGTYNAPVRSEVSPISAAYRADMLPKVVVTDRRHRIRFMVTGIQAYDGPYVENAIKERLAAEIQ